MHIKEGVKLFRLENEILQNQLRMYALNQSD